MKKVILFCIAVLAVFLPACGQAAPHPAAYSVVAPAPADFSERVSVSSLADWDYFNADGSYTDNCLHFLRGFTESHTDFPELDSVKIGAFTLTRDPKEFLPYEMQFDFTVTASGLDALPVGEYQTVLSDVTDCYLRFLSSPALPPAAPDYAGNAAAKAVTDWIECDFTWDTPGYGNFKANKATVQKLCNYYTYIGEAPTVADFCAAAARDFGISLSEDEVRAVTGEGERVKRRAVGSQSCYTVTDVTDGRVTVRFFADCNRFVHAMTAVYTVDENGHILSCEVTEKSPYAPYGLHEAF